MIHSETTATVEGDNTAVTIGYWRFEHLIVEKLPYVLVAFIGCQLAQHLDVQEEIRRFWAALQQTASHLPVVPGAGYRLLVNTNMIEPHLVIFLDRFLGEQQEVDLVAWRGFGSSQEVCSQVRRFTVTQSRLIEVGPRGVISVPLAVI